MKTELTGDFQELIKVRPSLRWDWVALLDLFCLGGLLIFALSHFFLTPGLAVDLPQSRISSENSLVTRYVLTIRNPEVLFFEGEIMNPTRFQKVASTLLENDKISGEVWLLIKVDASLNVQNLVDFADMARRVGFQGVQIATQEQSDDLFQLYP